MRQPVRSGHLLILSLLLALAAVFTATGCGAAKPAAPAVAAATRPIPVANNDAAVAHLMIPSIKVDRPVVEGTVDAASKVMVAPSGPFDIAYYTYSARPGTGNAVFSGHVDYHGVGPAVFWDLGKLREGDAVIVRLADGTELRYAVRFNRVYTANAGPWQELFGAMAVADGVTIYTCSGDFDPQTRTYDKRRVVRAERVA